MADNCNSYIGDWQTTDGFMGANCGTWFGGFSRNCKDAEAQAKAMRNDCANDKLTYSRNLLQSAEIIKLLKFAAGAVLLYFFLKWYLK